MYPGRGRRLLWRHSHHTAIALRAAVCVLPLPLLQLCLRVMIKAWRVLASSQPASNEMRHAILLPRFYAVCQSLSEGCSCIEKLTETRAMQVCYTAFHLPTSESEVHLHAQETEATTRRSNTPCDMQAQVTGRAGFPYLRGAVRVVLRCRGPLCSLLGLGLLLQQLRALVQEIVQELVRVLQHTARALQDPRKLILHCRWIAPGLDLQRPDGLPLGLTCRDLYFSSLTTPATNGSGLHPIIHHMA